MKIARRLAALLLLAVSGCVTTPLGSGLLVHPETDEEGIGMVTYRVGGYESARRQMFAICGWYNDVQIVKKEVSVATVEEGALYATNTAAAANSSSAEVSSVTLSFMCVERSPDEGRNYQSVLPLKRKDDSKPQPPEVAPEVAVEPKAPTTEGAPATP